jgi:D,D-heptose 1,7-bisphosphate phosphatase
MGGVTATVRQCVVRVDDSASSGLMVGGRSCLGWLLREFIRYGVTDFLLLADRAPAGLAASLPRPVRIDLAPPPAGAGSAAALWHVRDRLQERFLWCDGTRLFDGNLAPLLEDAAGDGPAVIGRMVRPGGGIASRMGNRPDHGIGLFRRALPDHLQPAGSLPAGSFADDVLPDLARRGLLLATTAEGRFDRGGDDPDPAAIVRRLRRRALFLDRDGVLNVDHGYVGSRERFEWVEGAREAIRYASQAGWHVFVVTNQSGIARGMFTEHAVRDLLDWMVDQARASGGTIDDVRYCPFHPEAAVGAYRQAHPWRKPLPGMVLDLMRAWEVDPKRAVMVGDQASDMAAAAAAGIAGHLFPGGNLLGFLRPILEQDV